MEVNTQQPITTLPETSDDHLEAIPNHRSVFITARDGKQLHTRVFGRENEIIPVVCLPDTLRNSLDFEELANYLAHEAAPKRQVICPDFRGRGRSDHDAKWQNYTLDQELEDLLTILARLNIEHAHFIGSGRGGFLIHALAAKRPTAIKSFILNDVGPVINALGLSREKLHLKHAERYQNIEEVARNLKAKDHSFFPDLSDNDWIKLAKQFYKQSADRVTPCFDPALLNWMNYLDLSQPINDLWQDFFGLRQFPATVLRGANSDFLAVETVEKMQNMHTNLQAFTVPNQGHTPLLWDIETHETIARHCIFSEESEA